MSGKDRIRRLLLENKGQIVTGKQIVAAANITSAQRRLRELREEGWPISSHIDDDTLKPGEYRLTGDPPADAGRGSRKALSARIRAQVLSRDGSVCQMCGAVPEDRDPQFPQRNVRLHVGHIIHRNHGGSDELSNLRTLCSRCNQGAKHLTQRPPDYTHLLGQIRSSSRDVQLEVLEWLKNKFES